MNEVLKAIAHRSSTRAYTGEKLTEREREQLLLAGLQAPTATNRQEIHITALDGSAPILAEIDAEKNAGRTAPANFYYGAPAVFILSGEAAFRWTAVDAGIAVQSMALAAESLGLGSLIIGCVRDVLTGPKAAYYAQALRFPEGYEYQIAIAVGHKAAEKTPHAVNWEKNTAVIE